MGIPPHVTLDYALPGDQAWEYRVEQQLQVLQQGVLTGSVRSAGPLRIAVTGSKRSTFELRLELGPLAVTRWGDTRAIELAGDMQTKEPSAAWIRADATLTPDGSIPRWRVLDQRQGDLALPILETLMSLDQLPAVALGVGARWRTLVQDSGSTHATRSDHELILLDPSRAVFRVWRTRTLADGRQASALGEWTFFRERWPATGQDRVNFRLPQPSDALLSASFRVIEAAEQRP